MTAPPDHLTDAELDERLRTTFSTVMPLLDRSSDADVWQFSPETDFDSDRGPDPEPGREFERRAPSGGTRRRSIWLASAAAVLLAVMGIATVQRDRVEAPVSDDVPTPGTTLGATLPVPGTTIAYDLAEPSTSLPEGCSDPSPGGCIPYARLAVAPAVSSFYVGPASLGTPVVALEDFDRLVRCVEVDAAGQSCLELEGFAGVGTTAYPGGVVPDTSGGRSADALDVEIGTTFARITPGEYADRWQPIPEQADPDREDATVRGNPAVVFGYFDVRSVVWEERPGVLVWVEVPASRADELLTIAEGVRAVPGPTSIPWIVTIPDDRHGEVYDATDNDSDNLLVGRRDDGVECVGFGYIESACTGAINEQTFIEFIDDRPLLTGIAPPEVVEVRFRQGAAVLAITQTRPVAATVNVLFSEFIDADGPIIVEWVDAAGTILARTDPVIDRCDPACG